MRLVTLTRSLVTFTNLKLLAKYEISALDRYQNGLLIFKN